MAGSTKDEREERILDAAAELIVYYGYDKTTVSDIAAKAGVSKGAIYLHWPGKDDLFEALLWRETWRYIDQWLTLVENDPRGGTLFGMFRDALAVLSDSPFIRAIVLEDRRILGDFTRRNGMESLRQRYTMNQEFVRMMQAAGGIRQDVDPDILAYLMGALRLGIFQMDEVVPPENAPPLQAVIEAIAEMLDRAYGAQNAESNEAGKRIIQEVVRNFRAQQDQRIKTKGKQ